jgi:GNAT superfamily N-acetyltransferase
MSTKAMRAWCFGAMEKRSVCNSSVEPDVHPLHRTYAVMTELLTKIATVANERGISELKSHVYKTNRLSVAFHRKLGFQVTPEDIRCKLYLEQHGSWSKHLPSMASLVFAASECVQARHSQNHLANAKN